MGNGLARTFSRANESSVRVNQNAGENRKEGCQRESRETRVDGSCQEEELAAGSGDLKGQWSEARGGLFTLGFDATTSSIV